MRRFIPASLACLVVCAAAPAVDVVTTRSQGKRRGRVEADGIGGVTLVREARVTIAPGEILDVRYGRTPLSFDRAGHLFGSRRYADALAHYRKALDDPDRNRLLAQYILRALARCQDALGRREDAAKTRARLLKEVPDTRFLIEVADAQQAWLLERKDYDSLTRLARHIERHRKGEAKLLYGRIAEARGKWADAIRRYGEAEALGGSVGDLGGVAIARVHLRRGKLEQAERKARAILRSGDRLEPRVYAQAHMVIGDILMARAMEDRDLYRDAAVSFLRVPLLYAGDANTEPEALFKAARCFAAREDKTSKGRARGLYKRLIARYPQSTWMKRARENLSRLSGS